MIRTPDQRLRVFVSSTLRELEPERRAVRAAVEAMRLAPVMFELGARPHPPRDLYRAYLDQSDVFVGIYGESYGWVAPGEDISGLEDEYRLAPRAMPKLIYIKASDHRDERLLTLIARIQDDDTASYVSFSTSEELAERVASDLATLLAERFDARQEPDAPPPAAPPSQVPAPYTEAVGREEDVTAILGLLADDGIRLVTLVGPGGIGKSRLAIEVALRAEASADREVAFVLLEHVSDPGRVVPAIAAELGVRDSGREDLVEDFARAIGDRRMLVVLDNFEQVLDAAPVLVAMFTALPCTTFLVTSRARLRIRGERVFEVQPLALPDLSHALPAETALASPAVRLFRERARAANPMFEVTDDNVDSVVGVCTALEGVPLAIELAAARVRVIPPQAMLDRLERRMPLPAASARDLPDRQRTIEATIAWSVGLLPPGPRALLVRLGVFEGDFTLEAAEAVGAGVEGDADVLTLLTDLIDNSLVRSKDLDDIPMFGMLATVRQFALAQLEAGPDADDVRRLHTEHYVRLALETAPLLQGRTQLSALRRLGAERDNLRASGRHMLATGDVDVLSTVVWELFLYWWIRGLMPEARRWMEAVLATGVELSTRSRAIALGYSSWVSLWQERGGVGPGPLEKSVVLFREADDPGGAALALTALALAYLAEIPPQLDRSEEAARSALAVVAGQAPSVESMITTALGRVHVLRGDAHEAVRLFDEALAQAESAGDLFAESLANTNRAWAGIALGVPRPELFERNLRISTELGHVDGVAYGLEGLIAIAVLHGDVERAGVLAGAAAAIRDQTGVGEQESIVTFQPFVDRVLATDAAPLFRAARARGRAMTVHEATEYALASTLASTPASVPPPAPPLPAQPRDEASALTA